MKIKLLLKVFAIFILLIVLQLLITFCIVQIFNVDIKYGREISFIGIDISFLIIVLLSAKFWQIKVFRLFKKIKIKHFLFVLFISLIIVLLFPLLNIIDFSSKIMDNNTGMMQPFDYLNEQNNLDLYYIFRTILIMPILEEIFYRGIIQNKLHEKFSMIWSIVISSLFFAIGHMEIEQAFTVFFSSLVIGYLYYKSKNLTIVLLLHSLINIGFLFFKINYENNVSFPIIIYHVILVFLIIILSKKFPKKYNYGN